MLVSSVTATGPTASVQVTTYPGTLSTGVSPDWASSERCRFVSPGTVAAIQVFASFSPPTRIKHVEP